MVQSRPKPCPLVRSRARTPRQLPRHACFGLIAKPMTDIHVFAVAVLASCRRRDLYRANRLLMSIVHLLGCQNCLPLVACR